MRRPLCSVIVLMFLVSLIVTGVSLTDSWHQFGFDAGERLFTDLGYVLSAFECTRLGFDVVLANPCDVMSRNFIYPPAWLWLSFIPVGPSATVWFGVLLAVVYIFAAAYVLRPVGRMAWIISLGLLLSPSSLYLIERGNVDMAMFIISICVLLLASSGGEVKTLVSTAMVAITTVLKVYPVALLAITLPPVQEAKRLFKYVVIIGIVWFTYVVMNASALVRFASGVPWQPSLAKFGASILPWSIELVTGSELPPVLNSAVMMFIIFASLTGMLLVVVVKRCPPANRGASREVYLFVGGSLILAFCFLTTINVSYRLVFVILTVPYLLEFIASSRFARHRVLGWFLLLWGMVVCWHMLLVRTVVNQFASLTVLEDVLIFKPWVDGYIVISQAVTWLYIALITAMSLDLVRGLKLQAFPSK